ncbi:hypothetical protein [Yersinia enterocolitica]|uniref:hypothetical protein n=1 Tax=Yersinia enterocolitica TaxID=630 RepID=UPI000AE1A141|nr:hypothetical protein [Yersinia enterocolitica]
MSGHGRPRKARLSMDCESRWLVSPKDAGGLPAGQYFAQAAGAGGPACPPARLRRLGLSGH